RRRYDGSGSHCSRRGLAMSRAALAFAVLPFVAVVTWADPPEAPEKESSRYEFRREHDPDGTGKFYMGREIAQVMGHQAAGWLERPEREQEEQPARLIETLKFKAGEVVADVGAGSGYLSFRIAPHLNPNGKVLAVDI